MLACFGDATNADACLLWCCHQLIFSFCNATNLACFGDATNLACFGDATNLHAVVCLLA